MHRHINQCTECGSQHEVGVRLTVRGWRIRCYNCGEMTYIRKTIPEAIAIWNAKHHAHKLEEVA